MTLALQFGEAITHARTNTVLDGLARKLFGSVADGRLTDADAEALTDAIGARREALQGIPPSRTRNQKYPATGRICAGNRPSRREKVFGLGRPTPLDRNAK